MVGWLVDAVSGRFHGASDQPDLGGLTFLEMKEKHLLQNSLEAQAKLKTTVVHEPLFARQSPIIPTRQSPIINWQSLIICSKCDESISMMECEYESIEMEYV